MTRDELKIILEKKEINPQSYDLEGGHPSEKYCIEHNNYGVWSVYYSERGNRNDEKIFDNESDACACLLKCLVEDPTTRLN